MVPVVDNMNAKKMTVSSADMDMKANIGTFSVNSCTRVMLGNIPCETWAMVLPLLLPLKSMTMPAHMSTAVRAVARSQDMARQ